MDKTLTEQFPVPKTLFIGPDTNRVLTMASPQERLFTTDIANMSVVLAVLSRADQSNVGGIFRISPLAPMDEQAAKELAVDVREEFDDFRSKLLHETGPARSFQCILFGHSAAPGYNTIFNAVRSTPQFDPARLIKVEGQPCEVVVDVRKGVIGEARLTEEFVKDFKDRNPDIYRYPGGYHAMDIKLFS